MTVQSSQGTSNLPAFMQADAADGKENIGNDDIIIPRVALMQSVSDEVEAGKIRAGNFLHILLEEDMGTAIDDIVIVSHSKRYVLWSPRHEGGGILARASDGKTWDEAFQGMEFEVAPSKDRPRYKVKWKVEGEVGRDVGLGAWGSSDPENPDSSPAATLTHVLVCVSLSRLEMGPFTILLQRTAEKSARELLTKIRLDKAPLYGQVYRLSSTQSSGPSGDFYNYSFSKNGHVQELELYQQTQAMYESFRGKALKVDDSMDGSANAGNGDSGVDDGDVAY